jgi:Protein of unknown function (DUF3237)
MNSIVSGRRMFRIQAHVESTALGEVPGGFRIDARCGPDLHSEVTSQAQGDWQGLEGELVSGNDWVTVYSNAVMRLHGRLTIKAKDAEPKAPPVLIDMLYTGAVDLTGGDDTQVKRCYEAWRRGELSRDRVPTTLAINFELGTVGNPQRPQDAVRYARYARLARAQFVAIGETELEHKPYSPIKSFDVEIFELAAGQARS